MKDVSKETIEQIKQDSSDLIMAGHREVIKNWENSEVGLGVSDIKENIMALRVTEALFDYFIKENEKSGDMLKYINKRLERQRYVKKQN
ncbi:hypothetical protein HOB10_00665 [Candidatus Parcubacteria bacterium]|jgi:hypothetical protein|nr:hypothetical protein [Candidatus Parcubacteria bacterium]